MLLWEQLGHSEDGLRWFGGRPPAPQLKKGSSAVFAHRNPSGLHRFNEVDEIRIFGFSEIGPILTENCAKIALLSY